MFKKSLYIFVRRIPLMAMLTFQIAFIAYQVHYQLTNYANPVGHILWFLEIVQTFCTPLFIMSIFISYEYIHGIKKSSIEECIWCQNFGKVKLYSYPILVLLIKSALIFLVMLIAPITVSLLSNNKAEMILHIISVTMVNTFLTQIVASLIGVLIAIKFRRVVSYVLMTAISLYFLGVFTNFIFHLSYFYKIHIWSVHELITNLLPPTVLYGYDYQYGADYELQNWNFALFWIFLILTIILFLLLNRKQRKNLVIIALSCSFCLINLTLIGTSSQSLSLGEVNMSNGAFWENIDYYSENKGKTSKADFEISAYNMDFHFDRILHAKVDMSINSQENLNEYIFTLYHGYKISSVKDDEGNDLEYIRDSDYFTVKSDKAINTISITYSGFSHLHYSNEQAVSLPGCFPYYPWAGFYPLYSTSYIATTGLPHSDFTVKLSGSKHLYTNLPSENDIFKGSSDALTIMGGFLKKAEFSKYDVIIQSYEPISRATQESYFNNLQNKITELETTYNIDSNIILDDYRFFIGNDTLINRTYYTPLIIFDNHILILPNESQLDDYAKDIIFLLSGKNLIDEGFSYNQNIGG